MLWRWVRFVDFIPCYGDGLMSSAINFLIGWVHLFPHLLINHEFFHSWSFSSSHMICSSFILIFLMKPIVTTQLLGWKTIPLLMKNVAKPTIVLNLYWKCNQTKSWQFWDRVFNYSSFEQQLVKYAIPTYGFIKYA